MIDMNKERLRNLVANAILELWKKETGSLSQVVIEGTICITAGGGRTTVIQVANKFTGHIPEYSSNNNHESKLLTSQISNGGFGGLHFAPSVDTKPTTTAAVTAYLDDLSPASLVSPPTDGPSLTTTSGEDGRSLPGVDHQENNNNSAQEDKSEYPESSRAHDSGIDVSAVDRSETSISLSKRDLSVSKNQDDIMSDDDEERGESRDLLNDSNNSTAGPVCAGTGYYTLDDKFRPQENNSDAKHNSNDAAMHETSGMDTTEEFVTSDNDRIVGPLMSTPKHSVKSESGMEHSRSSVLDLSRRDPDDLALSPPHSYTAQVRDVIRQRLLAQKFATNQLEIENQPVNEHSVKSETSLPAESSFKSESVTSEERDSQHSNSLPPTPIAGFPMGPLLSPNHTPRLMFPFPPFTPQQRNMLYAEQIQALMHRSMSGMFPPQSPQPVDRPASEPMNLVQSPTTPDKLSLSFDGRQTPQSTNGEQKVYSCDYCHKTFLFKSKYQEHLPVHTNARPYQCRLCSRTYKYKYDLRVHLRTHLGIPTKSTLCPFCNAKFDTNKLLRHHIKETHREHHTALTEEQLQMFDAI